ncbi:hypothetical protein [Nocardia brasiliensis]|uniref:LppU family putative lipoprotein n=1 Tax=Nocardia brasiliensis TaxID=37326 RepID=UPI00366C0981
MPSPRKRAAIVLSVFVIGTALATAVVGAVALSLNPPEEPTPNGPGRADETASAATTSIPPSVTEEPQLLATTTPPPSSAVRGAVNKSAAVLPVDVGECVELHGTGEHTVFGKTACGSANSTYRIIEKAPPNAHCPSDADHTYHHTGTALCLDIDWIVDGCMQLVPHQPKRVDCTVRGVPDAVKVVEIKQATTDVNACTSGDRGIVYHQRQFVVCVARL